MCHPLENLSERSIRLMCNFSFVRRNGIDQSSTRKDRSHERPAASGFPATAVYVSRNQTFPVNNQLRRGERLTVNTFSRAPRRIGDDMPINEWFQEQGSLGHSDFAAALEAFGAF